MGRLAEAQRKLLEQMMGAESMGIIKVKLHFSDDKVCKNYLCGTCPHIVFTNTKMDLGPCPRAHQEKLQEEFAEAKAANPDDPAIQRIEGEWQRNIFGIVDDCDRRIHASQRRLEKTPEENAKTTALMREIGEIELSIQDGTTEIEQLGEAGKITESIEKLAAVEALKLEKNEKEVQLQNLAETSGASGHQKLRVCEICGAYLSVLDSDRRLADHFGGKMHLGYKELRELLAKIHEARSRPRPIPTIVAPPTSQLAPPTPTQVAPGSGLSPTPSSSSALPPAGSPSAPPTGPASDHESRSRSDRDRERDSRGPSSSSSRRYEDEGRRDGGGSRRGYDDDRRESSRRHEDSSR
ncbi:hypothetical protein BDY24DRAFT_337756 [Mrakia frigida]|uniref:Luc7p n=1 Tax=Mrakia frigida TaxID=29902 RepID=UPI003FCC1E53